MTPTRAAPHLRTLALVTATLGIVAAGCVATPAPVQALLHATMTAVAAMPFQRDMNVGMARMMQDMHSPGWRRLVALRQPGVGGSTEFPALGGTRGP